MRGGGEGRDEREHRPADHEHALRVPATLRCAGGQARARRLRVPPRAFDPDFELKDFGIEKV